MAGLPLRLRAALAKARLFPGRMSIRYLRVEEVLHSQSQQPVSHEALSGIIRDRHSIVWLSSGASGDPLTHPGIAHLARLIVSSGHTLFLETDGVALRQRIHEFQPSSRLFLVVRFLGSEAKHDQRMGRSGAFRAALEGIRAARLSGFWICAKLDTPPVDSPEFMRLYSEIAGLQIDGIMSSAASSPGADTGPNAAWNRVLRLAESARPAPSLEPSIARAGTEEPGTLESGCEEVAQV